jgi:hypothetical protein
MWRLQNVGVMSRKRIRDAREVDMATSYQSVRIDMYVQSGSPLPFACL